MIHRWICSYEVQSLAAVTPACLADDCCLLLDAGRHPLRSDSNELRNLLVPRTHSKLGDKLLSCRSPPVERPSTKTTTAGTVIWHFQTISENLLVWRPKHIITVMNLYMLYKNSCMYVFPFQLASYPFHPQNIKGGLLSFPWISYWNSPMKPGYVIFDLALWLHYMKTWCHPQYWKYVTYCTVVRGGLRHSHR